MSRIVLALLVGALLPLPLAAQEPAPPPAAASAPAPMLGPTDAVRITVYRRPELSGEFDLAPDGSIVHPLLRQVRVTGIPVAEAEERIRTFLERYDQNPQFVLEPLYRIAVLGEVRQPKVYSLTPGLAVSDAVAAAGGPTERGRLDRVQLLRGGETRVLDLTRTGPDGARMPLQSGDQLLVERQVNIFRDYIAPAGSITAALAAVLSLIFK